MMRLYNPLPSRINPFDTEKVNNPPRKGSVTLSYPQGDTRGAPIFIFRKNRAWEWSLVPTPLEIKFLERVQRDVCYNVSLVMTSWSFN